MLACTARSRAVGIPRRRNFPDAFGIIRSRTGSGANLRALRSSRNSRRNSSPSLAPIERGFTPSTPAVRAPRLPRTRSQPTVRKAGSQTRLNRSSNRRSGPSVAHRCSLVWIFSTREQASSRLGHGASVFTGDLLTFQQPPCQPAGSLRHVTGFPGLGLLRTLRPIPASSADSGPARRHPPRAAVRATPGRFPRSPRLDRRGRRPALPLAASPRVRRRPSSWPHDRLH